MLNSAAEFVLDDSLGVEQFVFELLVIQTFKVRMRSGMPTNFEDAFVKALDLLPRSELEFSGNRMQGMALKLPEMLLSFVF